MIWSDSLRQEKLSFWARPGGSGMIRLFRYHFNAPSIIQVSAAAQISGSDSQRARSVGSPSTSKEPMTSSGLLWKVYGNLISSNLRHIPFSVPSPSGRWLGDRKNGGGALTPTGFFYSLRAGIWGCRWFSSAGQRLACEPLGFPPLR